MISISPSVVFGLVQTVCFHGDTYILCYIIHRYTFIMTQIYENCISNQMLTFLILDHSILKSVHHYIMSYRNAVGTLILIQVTKCIYRNHYFTVCIRSAVFCVRSATKILFQIKRKTCFCHLY